MVMACIEIEARALKSNFLKQIRMNSTQQSLFDDLWSVDNVVNVSPDEFSVDDLLDLSDKDFANSDYPSSDRFSDEKKNNSIISSNFSSTGDLASLPENEIHLSVDEMENLEWLSQIVDDSILELSPSLPPATLKEATGKLPVIPSCTVLGLSYPVPRKIRSKRSKKTGRVWSSLTESSMDDSSSYDSSATMFSANPVQLFHCFMSFLKPATKKFKNNPVHKNNSSESTGCVTLRRCTHCHVHKTPQWRTGPEGPKTLCNACGVRFKSGRLFPEYRPACSPTFSGRLHSNSHRKVLEMRKLKENEDIKPGFRSGLGSLSC